MRLKKFGITISMAMVVCAPTQAHHSSAMFDMSKNVELTATVKEFDWVNPHVWVIVIAPDEQGAQQEWRVQCLSINALMRSGWSQKTFHTGDKISITIAPMRDNTREGFYKSAKLPTGQVITAGGPA